MKVKDLIVLLVLAFVTKGMVLSACASDRANLVDKGEVSIERVPSKRVYFRGIRVFQDDSEVLITGRVKSRSYSQPDSGHVDIAIVSSEGEVLEKVSASHTPSTFPRRGGRRHIGVRFDVPLAIVPPKGSNVRLSYHRGSKSDSKTFDCGENAALPDALERRLTP